MPGTYTSAVTRPDVVATQPLTLIQNAIYNAVLAESLVLGAGATRVQVPTGSAKFPVLSALPAAYWLTADEGLKQTSKEAWVNKDIIISELATLIPVPDAVAEDLTFDIFAQIQPLIVMAAGKLIDQGVLFGTNLPAVQATAIGGAGIVAAANAAGNNVAGTGAANALKDIIAVAQSVAANGYPVTGFAGDALLEWSLMGVTDTMGRPLFIPSTDTAGLSSILGRPFSYVNNGAWNAALATIIAGDWSRLVVGMRRDITFEIFNEGVITDETGKVVYNAMQQDAKILRMTMRVGFAVANPITPYKPSGGYPFAALTGGLLLAEAEAQPEAHAASHGAAGPSSSSRSRAA